MIRRPSRWFVAAMIPLALAGVTGAWAWQRANSAPLDERAALSFYELASRKPSVLRFFGQPVSPEAKMEARRVVERFMSENPELDRPRRSVPDEQNGFLHLYLLGGPPNNQGSIVSDTLLNLLQGHGDWDSQRASEELEKHSSLVARIERIAAMPDASSENMPPYYDGFVNARAGKYAAEILLLKARIAAESGKEASSLEYVRAAFNIGNHYRTPEGGTLLCETVAILIDLTAKEMIMKTILPALGSDADLEAWNGMMRGRGYNTVEFARVMRCEWENSLQFFLLPHLLVSEDASVPGDGEELARTFTEDYAARVAAIRRTDLRALPDIDDEITLKRYSGLSRKSRDIAGIFVIGSGAWSRGYVRVATVSQQFENAMKLLIMEKAGAVLNPASTGSLPPDPLTGRPFAFDPSTRTLSAVDPVCEVEPLVLPF